MCWPYALNNALKQIKTVFENGERKKEVERQRERERVYLRYDRNNIKGGGSFRSIFWNLHLWKEHIFSFNNQVNVDLLYSLSQVI